MSGSIDKDETSETASQAEGREEEQLDASHGTNTREAEPILEASDNNPEQPSSVTPTSTQITASKEHTLRFGVGAFVLLTLMIVATTSLSEVSSRISKIHSIEQKISELHQETSTSLSGIFQSLPVSTPNSVANEQSFDSYLGPINQNKDRISEKLALLDQYTKMRDWERQFSQEGGFDLLVPIHIETRNSRAFGNIRAEDPVPLPEVFLTYAQIYLNYLNASTETLTAIVVICCTALGAMIAGLREGGEIKSRAVLLGAASGFVVYIGIKGGRFIFVLDGGDAALITNPYGTAFAGIIAGLFAEPVYQLLRKNVEAVIARATPPEDNAPSSNSNTGQS